MIIRIRLKLPRLVRCHHSAEKALCSASVSLIVTEQSRGHRVESPVLAVAPLRLQEETTHSAKRMKLWLKQGRPKSAHESILAAGKAAGQDYRCLRGERILGIIVHRAQSSLTRSG